MGVVVQVATEGGRVVGCYRLGSFQVQARRPVMSLRSWSVERMPVNAVVVSRLGVDRRWQRRGLGTWLMWHALELAAAVAPAVRARLVVAPRGDRTCARVRCPIWVPGLRQRPAMVLPADAGPAGQHLGFSWPTAQHQRLGSISTRSLSLTHRPGDGGVGRGPQAERSWIASRHYPGCRKCGHRGERRGGGPRAGSRHPGSALGPVLGALLSCSRRQRHSTGSTRHGREGDGAPGTTRRFAHSTGLVPGDGDSNGSRRAD